MDTARVAIIGLGFGAEFIPIYQRHPHTNMYAICQRHPEHLAEVGDKFGIAKRYTDFTELIADPEVDVDVVAHAFSLHIADADVDG